jgi:hypothetical protein
MGEAHGVLAGKEIIHLLDRIVIPYLNKYRKNAWTVEVLPLSARFVFPEKYERELVATLAGIEREYPARNDRMLLSLGREISINDLREMNCLSDIIYSRGGCSSFSAWGTFTRNGGAICGYNMDERSISGDLPFTLLAWEAAELDRRSTIENSAPGAMGTTTTLNRDGVIIMGHHEKGLGVSTSERWIPRAIVQREAIESAACSDLPEQIAAGCSPRERFN